MATMINGQLILEEEYDENYLPTEQGKLKTVLYVHISLYRGFSLLVK